MVQLNNFFFFITSMVVPRGTAAPVLLKWFVSRDVPTGAPSSNGTIIPIPISSFPLLVYLHSRKSGSSDGESRRVLVRAPLLLLPDIGRSSSETARNALFRFVVPLTFSRSERSSFFSLQSSAGDFSYLESFCGVLRLLFFLTFFSLPPDDRRERGRNGNEQRRNERCLGHPRRYSFGPKVAKIGLEALTLPTSNELIVGHDYKQIMKMNISHGGVCICMLGVLLSNAKKNQFTPLLPLGSELHMGGKERCCLRGLDHLHGPTFHSICGNLMIYKPSHKTLTNDEFADLVDFPASYGKLEHFLHPRWWKKGEQHLLTMFPEKRYFRETSTTEVAIHTNLFTDLYALIGTGRTGGWYTTIMKLPFLFFIRIGFMLASLGGSRSLLRQLQKDKLRWN